MDGTLTVPVHDFDAIRIELGLPPGRPILETLASMPTAQADPLHRRLLEIERELAERGQAGPGVCDVLHELKSRGSVMAILTRNSGELAHITLQAAGLADFFEPELVLGREDAEPKPSPQGIQRILSSWSAEAATTRSSREAHGLSQLWRRCGAWLIWANRHSLRAGDARPWPPPRVVASCGTLTGPRWARSKCT